MLCAILCGKIQFQGRKSVWKRKWDRQGGKENIRPLSWAGHSFTRQCNWFFSHIGCLPWWPYENTTPWKSHIGGRRIESLSASCFLSVVFHWLQLDPWDVTILCTCGLSSGTIGQHFIWSSKWWEQLSFNILIFCSLWIFYINFILQIIVLKYTFSWSLSFLQPLKFCTLSESLACLTLIPNLPYKPIFPHIWVAQHSTSLKWTTGLSPDAGPQRSPASRQSQAL